MRIEPATISDVPEIHVVYEWGRALQIARQSPVWPPFTDAAILREISAGALFVVRDDGETAGVFSMIDADPLIWGEDERGEHLYLHRIVRAPSYSGRGLVLRIIQWAFDQCVPRKRTGLRIDTWGSNTALIDLYVRHGFRLLGMKQMPADPRLSVHYHGIELAMLEANRDDG